MCPYRLSLETFTNPDKEETTPEDNPQGPHQQGLLFLKHRQIITSCLSCIFQVLNTSINKTPVFVPEVVVYETQPLDFISYGAI